MRSNSVIIVTYNRKDELEECILSLLKQIKCPDEIVVIDNNSEDGTSTLFTNKTISHSSTKYFQLRENHGVAGGRNYGITQASGDILVFIDDDALIEPCNALNRIIERFEEDPTLGILSFKIINYHSKSIIRNEFPHVNKSLDPDKEFETTYFIGAGHAIRKEVFDKCGLYPEDYFYGMEELDLSFRAIDKGFTIVYFPDVIIWHKKSYKGRLANEKMWLYNYRNRLAVSYKYLKRRHLTVLAFVWFLKIFKKSLNFSTPLKGIFAFIELRKNLVREPVSDIAIEKITKLRGRVWY